MKRRGAQTKSDAQADQSTVGFLHVRRFPIAISVAAGLLLQVWGASCANAPARPTLEAAASKVPEGCLADLSGRWVHDDSSWQYDALDDGGTLSLTVFHQLTPDAGPRWRQFTRPKDGGTAVGKLLDAGLAVAASPAAFVILNRTPAGFIGESVAMVAHPVGRTCEARFKTEVLSCGDGGLTLRSQSEIALGDICQAPANPQPTVSLEHHLVRAPQSR